LGAVYSCSAGTGGGADNGKVDDGLAGVALSGVALSAFVRFGKYRICVFPGPKARFRLGASGVAAGRSSGFVLLTTPPPR
jgi:hypothetical protein